MQSPSPRASGAMRPFKAMMIRWIGAGVNQPIGACRVKFRFLQSVVRKTTITSWGTRETQVSCKQKQHDTNSPPDRKPRVAALTFVNNLFDKKCQTWDFGTLHFFVGFFFVAIPWCSVFFDHFVLWKWSFFCFASPKNRGSNECLWVIFPHLPVEIGTI